MCTYALIYRLLTLKKQISQCHAVIPRFRLPSYLIISSKPLHRPPCPRGFPCTLGLRQLTGSQPCDHTRSGGHKQKLFFSSFLIQRPTGTTRRATAKQDKLREIESRHSSSALLQQNLPLPPHPAVNPAFAETPPLIEGLSQARMPAGSLLFALQQVRLTFVFFDEAPPPRPACNGPPLDYVYVFLTAVVLSTLSRGVYVGIARVHIEKPDRYISREPESGAAPLLSMFFFFDLTGRTGLLTLRSRCRAGHGEKWKEGD
ncbi:hypothetical protein QBC41DRAFT_137347 [Cercophora samala]|uniref:Uncharacterized protein n=1 Tax=Cercophora samala TaxID=330535 RepID=A0AA40D8U7_9PEZI|nr:hypothetical protein QBC41DRAFT_137347 [Cercophora samala]